MTRFIYIVFGSIIGGLSIYFLALILDVLIEPKYRPSGVDEITRNFLIFVFVILVFVFIGGFVGNRLFKKSLTNKNK